MSAGRKITLSVGQALLILMSQNKNNPEMFSELKMLYFFGATTETEKDKILKWLTNEALSAYHISFDFDAINNDPSRRYFETHLAYHTLNSAIKNLSLLDVEAHWDSLKLLISQLPITKKVIDDFLQGQFNELENNPHLNPGDKTNIKEYSSILCKLNSDDAEDEKDKLGTTPFSHFTKQEKRKLALLALCSFTCTLINKDLPTLPLDLYGKDYYAPENRGQMLKPDQSEVKVRHLGLMKGHMPLANTDTSMAAIASTYTKPSERFHFNPQAKWVIDNFHHFVHPFSCSISGTMLLHLRVFSELYNRGLLKINDTNKFIAYMKSFIPLMIYHSGGHSFHEFTYPWKLKEVQETLHFLDFKRINVGNLFFDGNETAFSQALDETFLYHDLLLKRTAMHLELKQVTEKAKAHYASNAALFKHPVSKNDTQKDNMTTILATAKAHKI